LIKRPKVKLPTQQGTSLDNNTFDLQGERGSPVGWRGEKEAHGRGDVREWKTYEKTEEKKKKQLGIRSTETHEKRWG